MPLNDLSKIGKDAMSAPFPTDWKKYINDVLIKSYFDQPNVARKLATKVIPLEFDGRYEAEIPLENDLDDAEIGMEPGIADTELEGDLVTIPTPQIFQTMSLSEDKWAQMFAGKDRASLVMGRMPVKIKNKEDIYVFRGKTGISTGLIAQSTDLGNPAGAWGIQTNGKCTHFHTDIAKILALLDANGIPSEWPVDVVLTSYAYTVINATMYDYNPEISNRMVAEKRLRGGRIMQSDNIQASVLTTANTMFASVRAPYESAGWALLASGFDIKRQDTLWGHRIGIRQKVGAKVTNANLCYYMDGISNATS